MEHYFAATTAPFPSHSVVHVLRRGRKRFVLVLQKKEIACLQPLWREIFLCQCGSSLTANMRSIADLTGSARIFFVFNLCLHQDWDEG